VISLLFEENNMKRGQKLNGDAIALEDSAEDRFDSVDDSGPPVAVPKVEPKTETEELPKDAEENYKKGEPTVSTGYSPPDVGDSSKATVTLILTGAASFSGRSVKRILKGQPFETDPQTAEKLLATGIFKKEA
jgi:hypothetical protein